MGDPVSLDLLAAVLDPVRLAVLGSSVRSSASIESLSDRLGVEPRVVTEAIDSLRAAGLLGRDCRVDELVLRSIARALPPREPGMGEPVSGPWTDEEADVLGRFFADGRLVEIPGKAGKRELVLDKIVQEFEPGVRYGETVVADRGALAVPLMTENDDVVLRPWHESMIDGLIEAANDPRIPRYMRDGFPHPYTRDDAYEWMQVATAILPPLEYAVFLDDLLVGGAGGAAFSAETTGVAELGWWLNPQYWGRGITTMAVKALIRELFTHRGMDRLWAPVMAPNTASACVAQKVGMVLEGVAPLHYVKAGVRYDQLNYGITSGQLAANSSVPL